ncbi:MAG: 16S rRNA (guanine(966)-N(2))-methyltransferase RsmD [Nitrosomonadales bacterium]|jgi:16S rRNA (guanine(966)-N(2))-methyltransferase RsmD|nr:16S rRNA (guanine(966)-N(2))-methyltransferase RsmD [Nitrosomonadales bacterium]MBT5150475.1 16S rRNA (guanine(966)-N(2))-methyltransferase RsmD [Nitrosomonadales bacterium]MBT6251390.1 16S rRNA (guanine(966)-N(2))-methyltransferase RsmD [Nitrosomonadales bacterium]
MKDNNVKIIGGKWKRKNISFNEAKGLRPTLGKVRETLFNWLGQDLNDKKCLDLFAGTGALGFEALSRNAESCTFIENNPSTYQKLLENKKNLNADNAIIKKMSADFFIKDNEELFDIIFFDPPFILDNSIQLIELVRNFLMPKGVIYFETNIKLSENLLEIIKTSRAGKVYFHLVH